MSSNAPNYVLFLSSYAILLYQYRTWLLNGTAVNWITAKHLGLTSNHQGTHNLFLSPSHSMFLEPDINDDKEWRRQTRGNIAGWQRDLSTPSRGRDLRQRTRQWVNVTRPRIQKQSTPLMHPRIAAGRKKRKKKKALHDWCEKLLAPSTPVESKLQPGWMGPWGGGRRGGRTDSAALCFPVNYSVIFNLSVEPSLFSFRFALAPF